MASVNGDEEYESDPEEARLSLALRRRRVASDDEEEDEEVSRGVGVRVYDDELDDQGVPEDYEDEEEMDDEEEVGEEFDNVGIVNGVRVVLDGEVVDRHEVEGGEDEEKKEKEPFAVPTAGAFYMHDDRFGENAAGRHRRALGPHKIWDSRDKGRWGHDKFEELTSQDSNYTEAGRSFKEHHRGRGRNRGAGRGYGRGNRPKMHEDSVNQPPVPTTTIRGRGPQKYNPQYKRRSEMSQTQTKQFGKKLEKTVHSYSDKRSTSSSYVAYEAEPAKKNLVASNLSSASPPFYPSGSSTKNLNVAPHMDIQSATMDRNPQPSSMYRRKDGDDTLRLDKLRLEDTARKSSNASNVHPSGFTSTSKGPKVRNPGRGQEYAGHVPSPSMLNLDNGRQVSGLQFNPSKQGPPVQNQTHSHSQGSVQPMSKQSGNGSLASSSPPGHASLANVESAEDLQSASGKAKTAIVPEASNAAHGALSPFMYNGGQFMGATGNMGVAHGDPNYPTFLPVMQFGAQHPGGIGVPAVGMAFPGYVQPQHGQGSSEMTWLPVLAGAAGSTYCPPYMLDGTAYNPQLTGPPFGASSSNTEANTNKAINEWNPSQNLENVGEASDQRQNKPRRYSEMKFGQ